MFDLISAYFVKYLELPQFKSTGRNFMKIRLCFLLVSSWIPMSETDDQNNKLTISGLHLNVAIAQYPPFSMIIPGANGKFTYKGFNIDVIHWLARALDLKITFIHEDSSEVTKYGQTQAIINQLLTGKADIMVYLLNPTPDRNFYIDFSTLIGVSDYAILVPYPEEDSRTSQLTAPLQPFTASVWLFVVFAMLGTITIVSLIATYCRQIHPLENEDYQSTSFATALSQNLLFAWSTLLNHGYPIPSAATRFQSVRLVIVLWCLMVLILINYYSSELTSNMTITKLKPIVNSLEELAASDKLKPTIDMNSVLANRILNATSGTFKILGDSLRKNPNLLVRRTTDVIDNVLKHGGAYLQGHNLCDFFINLDTKKNGGKCRLTRSSFIGYSQFANFGLTKNAPYNDIINKQLLYLWDNGLLSYLNKIYTPNVDKCLVSRLKPEPDSGKPLMLKDFSSAFLLLGLGLSLAFLVFLLEHIAFYYKKIQKQKRVEIMTAIRYFW